VEELAGLTGELPALLERLPSEQQAALRGRVLDGRSYVELAQRLSCSELVLRKRVSRGLNTLRSQMEQR
jgi:RNA polymerase sigma-70 factor (ECF subfamily)